MNQYLSKSSKIVNLLQNFMLVSLATFFSNSSAYILQIFATRWLNLTELSEFFLGWQYILLGSIPASGLQLYTATKIAQFTKTSKKLAKNDYQNFYKILASLNFILIIILLISFPIISWNSTISLLTLIYIGLIILVLNFFSLIQGIYQGKNQFSYLGLLIFLLGLVKLLGGVLGLKIGIATSFLGYLVGLLILLSKYAISLIKSIKHTLAILKENFYYQHLVKILPAINIQAFILCYLSFDIIILSFKFTTLNLGSYGIGVLFTKIAYWLPVSVLHVFLPLLAKTPSTKYLWLEIIIIIGLLIIELTIINLFSNDLILIFGNNYLSIIDLKWQFILQGNLINILQILLIYSYTQKRYLIIYISWVSLIILALIVGNKSTEINNAITINNWGTIISIFLATLMLQLRFFIPKR